MKFKKRSKYRTRIFFLSAVFFISFCATSFTLFVVMFLSNQVSSNNYLTSILTNEPHEEIQKIIKSRSLSLFFGKQKGDFQFEGTYGTSWVIPNSVKESDNLISCYLTTNIHVIAKQINIDENNQYSWNNNFDSLFISFFNGKNYTNQVGSSLSDRQFLDKDDINVVYTATSSIEDESYKINNAPTTPKTGPFFEQNGSTYIKNRYIDFAILKMQINIEKNSIFYEWLKKIQEIDNGSYPSLKVDFLKKDEQDSLLAINNIYVGGFPIINNKVSWTSIDFDQSNNGVYQITTQYNYMPSQFLNQSVGITLGEKLYKSISNQIMLPYTNMGSGSSGSMVLAKINNSYKIIGIWWGVYVKENSHATVGSTEMFFSISNSNIGQYPNEWKEYNLLDEITQIISR